MKIKSIFKTIIPSAVLVAAFLPLSACHTDNMSTKAKSNDAGQPISPEESGQTRYVVINSTGLDTTVVSEPNEFSSDAQASSLQFTISSSDPQYYVSSIEKVMMCGEELILDTDYEVTPSEDGYEQIIKLKDTTSTEKLYSLYVFPKVEERVFGYEIDPIEAQHLNTELFGKITHSDSFTIRIKIKKESWRQGYYFSDKKDPAIEINGVPLTPRKDFNWTPYDTLTQYIDITVFKNVATGNLVISPSLVKGQEKDESVDVIIKAEGSILETRECYIPIDAASIAIPRITINNIDVDGTKDCIPIKCVMKTSSRGDIDITEYTRWDPDVHSYDIYFTDIGVAGNVEIDLDIKPKDSSQTPQETFNSDSWDEISSFIQFFGDNTDGFAKAYELEHLDDFIGFERSQKIFYMRDEYTRAKLNVKVVSTNQMPLAANKNTVTEPSNQKAYFTFMFTTAIYKDDGTWVKGAKADFNKIYPVLPDRNVNCWYREDPPTGWDKECDLRDYCCGTYKQYLKCGEGGKDLLTKYMKPIANRSVVQSAGVKEQKATQKYIRDMLFIPTATQLGKIYKSYKDCHYIMEDDIDGDRVFKYFQNKTWETGSQYLITKRPTTNEPVLGEPISYWLATPASNDEGASYEQNAYIDESGNIKRKNSNNELDIVPCFCM